VLNHIIIVCEEKMSSTILVETAKRDINTEPVRQGEHKNETTDTSEGHQCQIHQSKHSYSSRGLAD
jgi:hypothetical protein